QVVNKYVLDEYEDLYYAVVDCDWDEASKFLEEHPEAITKAITHSLDTVLHVSLLSMGELMSVEVILKIMPQEALEDKTSYGMTALHFAAIMDMLKP
ncbi:hypothetical protein MKX01_011090, partial [Papaver californicum]